jgi:hypothetical protein
MHLPRRGASLMIERPDSSFHNPYEFDADICDDCGAEMHEEQDDDGRMYLLCPECP